ncbi:uncharacterized protein METZ01_LOCUS241166, partial [marine metagenome]
MPRKYRGKEPPQKLKRQCKKNRQRITTKTGRYRKISALKKDCRDKRKYSRRGAGAAAAQLRAERDRYNALRDELNTDIDVLRYMISDLMANSLWKEEEVNRCEREKAQLIEALRRLQGNYDNKQNELQHVEQDSYNKDRRIVELEEQLAQLERRYREKDLELQNLEREYEDTASQWEERQRTSTLEMQ